MREKRFVTKLDAFEGIMEIVREWSVLDPVQIQECLMEIVSDLGSNCHIGTREVLQDPFAEPDVLRRMRRKVMDEGSFEDGDDDIEEEA